MPATDLEKLQGTWNITSLETNGEVVSGSSFRGANIVITGKQFISHGMGAVYEGTVEVDSTAQPKRLDLAFTTGHAKGTRNLGIYKLDGTTLTLCIATRGTKRPSKFATTEDDGFALETLEREGSKREAVKTSGKASGARTQKSKTVELEPTGPPTEIEGDWEMVAAVFNGVPMSDDMVKWCKRVTRGNVTKVLAGPQTMLNATFTLGPARRPREIDYTRVAGGKPQAGIIELSDGMLKICMAAAGKPRPKEFSSTKGDGRSLTIWRLGAGG